MPSEVLCYNKGCGRTFDPGSNGPDKCVYHPGVPVFHDALKGWTCCKRRTTDFSDFLNIPGCTKGCHNSEKPVEPVAPKVTSSKPKDSSDNALLEKVTHIAPKRLDSDVSVIRPSPSEPTIPLTVKTTASLQTALKKLSLEKKNQTSGSKGSQTRVCRHLSCNKTYTEGIGETCVHHPGKPVFHEGMKYWSCCQRKTSNFTSFLAQEGCVTGVHDWKVKTLTETGPCRHDWHQTGSVVVISIFAKSAVAENSSFKVNQVLVDIDLEYEAGERSFQLSMELDGIIDPGRSFVTLYGTKVEITLKKADATHWKRLNVPESVEEFADEQSDDVKTDMQTEKAATTTINCENNTDDKDEKEDSDLSGIDDVEFD